MANVCISDWYYLKQRFVYFTPNDLDFYLFSNNKDVKIFNIAYVRKLGDTIFFVKAKHSGSANENQNNTDFKGLLSIIWLSLGISVMFIQNLCVKVCLANGSIDRVKNIIKFKYVDIFGIGGNVVDLNDVDIILIEFDHYRGRPFPPYDKKLVPICHTSVQFRRDSRSQFPICIDRS